MEREFATLDEWLVQIEPYSAWQSSPVARGPAGQDHPMPVTDWVAWIGYEIAVALAVFGKTVSRFRRHVRLTPAGLESWTGLLLVAFSAAIGPIDPLLAS